MFKYFDATNKINDLCFYAVLLLRPLALVSWQLIISISLVYSLFIIHGYISYLTSGIDPVFVLSPTSLLPSVFVLWYIWLPGLRTLPVYWPWFLPVPLNLLILVHCASGPLLHLHFPLPHVTVEVIGKASFWQLCHVDLCCLKYVALLSCEQLDLCLVLFFGSSFAVMCGFLWAFLTRSRAILSEHLSWPSRPCLDFNCSIYLPFSNKVSDSGNR